ncbi:hypothetical protein DM02DRAFT_651560 [Periconia macrospinosa]|uniref:Uncharacterized protein n=1 Tax=Periconia macrospinosa TaxID=97972 RepID=A0A2V1E218_9PLEO|nr:hypothetical protein DM02DRAFT_651560 [Periconia macrospinosa]
MQFAFPSLHLLVAATSSTISSQNSRFNFTNPSLDCKVISQPTIYEILSSLGDNVANVANHIAPDVDLIILGHQPLTGHYYDMKHFYVNALYRLKQLYPTQVSG